MKYIFKGIFKSDSKKTHLLIPFNLLREGGFSSDILANIKVSDYSFTKNLIDMGNGIYFIQLEDDMIDNLPDNFTVEIEPIENISKEKKEIIKIDSILNMEDVEGKSGAVCIASLSKKKLEEVIPFIKTNTLLDLLKGLDEFNIGYSDSVIFPNEEVNLPKCAICYINGKFNLWYKGKFILRDVKKKDQIVYYLEILGVE